MDKIFKQEVSIKDEKFDINDMSYYRLYLSLGSSHLRVCVVDSLQNRCVLLEDYRFLSRLSTDELISSLNRIYDSDLFLKANFWQSVSIMLKEQAFTLVPHEFFEEKAPEKFLKQISPSHKDLLVIVSEQQSMDAVNIFHAEKKLVNWFQQTYHTRVIEFLHQTCGFIEGIRYEWKGKQETSLHLFVEGHYFLAAVLKDEQLEFCNVFSYGFTQDFVYFVLFVIDELRLEKDRLPLYLYGNVTYQSEIFEQLKRYIPRVKLQAEQPSWLNFGYEFNEINNYHYFDLYSMHLCPYP